MGVKVYPRECGGAPYASWVSATMQVYPRECGGALRPATFIISRSGLSPRVRGSLIPVTFPTLCPRSIPASAGEPLCDLI